MSDFVDTILLRCDNHLVLLITVSPSKSALASMLSQSGHNTVIGIEDGATESIINANPRKDWIFAKRIV